ncbi:hypothetical protein LX32DRAFT_690055 [Colletotrichum zoysiae]|uniref:Uncharacterized protein n=1 Tax=Colletotrichum zoysiae TaxID=1216348 RepID=A0AAD9HSN6_9PEZI|nr:hypothetical protein LX32DRAFT_690055 [Colletotrichum zoysiae]
MRRNNPDYNLDLDHEAWSDKCNDPATIKMYTTCKAYRDLPPAWAFDIHEEKAPAKKPDSAEKGAPVSEKKSTRNNTKTQTTLAKLGASQEKGNTTEKHTGEKTVGDKASQPPGSLEEVTRAVAMACAEAAPKPPFQGSLTLPTDVDSEIPNGKNDDEMQSQGEPNPASSDSPKQLAGSKRRHQHDNDTPPKRRFQHAELVTRRPVGRPKLPQPAAQSNTMYTYLTAVGSQSDQSQSSSEILSTEPKVTSSEQARKDDAEGGSEDSQDSDVGDDINDSDFLDEEEL